VHNPGVESELATLPLVDHHCHGVTRRVPDRQAFENLIYEGFEPLPGGHSHFDAPVGLAIRRWCAPVLDLDPMPSPEDYLARREKLGVDEANSRFLKAAGLGALLIDSGYRSEELVDVPGMGALAEAPAGEVVRLEAVAEEVAAGGIDAARYPDAFEQALHRRSEGAVGLKTIVAYRGGFGFDPSPPSRDDVVRATGEWFSRKDATLRLTDPVLLRFGIWTGADLARDRGFPLQIHSGFGDPDLTMHLANPTLLTDLIRELQRLPVTVVFLHCYPYHREAGYLAAVFPHVHFDLGSALNYLGPSAGRLMAEALEVAPFTKQLYSSDAFGLPELYYLGAVLFRRTLGAVLERWIAEDQCSEADASRIARLIGRDNAARIYPFGFDNSKPRN
jgi:predicted TIM-barrel fold metal-dependent hydrolase